MQNFNIAGISKLMECNININGQQRNVEFEVFNMAKALLGTRIIHEGLEQ